MIWLHLLALASLALGALCALVIAVDLRRHPQHMWIMNVVWPVTALFGSVLALRGYYGYGRLAAHDKAQPAMARGDQMPHKALTPFPVKVGKGTPHCGSGCALGDICAEWLAFLVPTVAVWFGWRSLFETKMFAVWIVDYLFAFAFGIAFQYFTIKPMRGLSVAAGLKEAVKADALSLTAWQVGMYGFMAIAHFYVEIEDELARLDGLRVQMDGVQQPATRGGVTADQLAGVLEAVAWIAHSSRMSAYVAKI